MDFPLIIILIFCSVSAGTFLFLNYLSRKSDPILGRLQHVENFSEALHEQFRTLGETDRKKLDPRLSRILSGMGQFVKRDEKGAGKRLGQAGYYQENAVRLFYGIKSLLAVSLFTLYILLGIAHSNGAVSLLLAVVMAALGYLIPDLVLSMRINRRQGAINSGLPDALDFLVICVEAGLGLNSALVRVGREIEMRCGELSEEFLMVNQEMRTGVTRDQALHNLADRNRSKHLKVLMSAILLSDRLGTNIADTLRAQSDSLRTNFRQQAEEQAAKAGIKMLLPLVVFILPTLFIVILGPAVIMMIKDVVPVMSK